MSLKTANIFTSFLSLLTSKLGIIVVLILFISCPIITMSYSVVNSTSQLTEEEQPHEDSEEDFEEDTLKLFSSINKISLIRKIVFIRKTPIKVKCANTLSLDVFLPPPKQA